MLERQRVAVVVPAFNEARLIGETIASIPAWVDDVIVVDDASHDETASQATETGDARVRVVRHEHNRGVGAAIATGYAAAFRAGARCAVVMAGDAQMHPDDLLTVARPVVRGDADYVKGDRLSHPSAFRAMPWTRYVGNQVLSAATRVALGTAVRDSQCGYTALSDSAAQRLPLDGLWPRYGYPNDLLGHAAECGLRIRDVVVRPVYGSEQSGMSTWHGLFVIPYVIARAASRRVRWTEPVRADVEPAGP